MARADNAEVHIGKTQINLSARIEARDDLQRQVRGERHDSIHDAWVFAAFDANWKIAAEERAVAAVIIYDDVPETIAENRRYSEDVCDPDRLRVLRVDFDANRACFKQARVRSPKASGGGPNVPFESSVFDVASTACRNGAECTRIAAGEHVAT